MALVFIHLLREFTDVLPLSFSVPVHVDNLACKAFAEGVTLAKRVKHVDVRFHAIRQ